ncbi:MAG: OFA family MFS transporter [Chitinispirillaceae bacterium]|jgi:OFA family oxalate/formate antiporter-like MFS transporter|nr:OFA family MFS transporter [Chitinispirillaceae bacterium]
MSEAKVMNRWLVVIGAILVQLSLGAIYAWSAFTAKLTAIDGAFHFTKTQTQVIFSVGLAVFAVVMALVAGKWQAKAGPRKVAITGGLILGAGYLLAGLSGASFWGILIGVGVLGGAGIGLGYVCPIATCVKWFPDKKGLITGLAVAGFGFGALIWIKLTSGFVFGPFDLTPGWKGLYGMGWSVSNVFILYGILFAVLVTLGAMVLKTPPVGWKPAGWTPPTGAAASACGHADFTTGQMVKTAQYWSLFVIFMISATCGLMVIGVIGLFGKDVLVARSGIEAAKAVIITGTAMGFFYSLMNGFGRIIWGSLSDGLGRKVSIVIMCLLQGIMMILFYYVGGNEWGLYLCAAIIGFNFGGNFALFPAATADYFGNKNVGTNYPWVFMAYGVGGIIGPILGGMMGDAKNWMFAFVPAGIACIIASFIAMSLKPPRAAA